MLKCTFAYRLCQFPKFYFQIYGKTTTRNYANKHQQQRNAKELKKVIKQQKISKNIELATKTLRPSQKIVSFDEVSYDKIIKPGNKKDVSVPLPNKFSPQFIEKYWYQWWVKNNFMTPRKSASSDKVFSMVIPPPNVTGKLHLGHALTCAIEDTYIRWQSMLGNETVWIPGSDHAGIATQIVVERQLEQEQGENRHDLGPEKFREAVWKWKENKGNSIYEQLERLGACLDWNRSVFTLDDNYCVAVKEAFIRLFNEGVIYRDECCVNWSCHLQSTISDLEVEPKVLEEPTLLTVPGYKNLIQFGTMHRFAYKLHEPVGDIDEIVVATTRLETVAGDEAVAVHPDDPRYSSLIGRLLKHPLRDNKLIPIIADRAVEMDLGTGAMKVTPAHDFLDFEIGKRHNLPITPVIDSDGNIIYEKATLSKRSDFVFIKRGRFDARSAVLTFLLQSDLYRGSHPQQSVLRLCGRSGDVVEPMIKEQWFVRVDEMAEQACQTIDDGSINFIQKSTYEKSWRNWLKKTGPWCISRQIWWGHQIPAYRCSNTTTGDAFWVAAHDRSGAVEAAVAESPGFSESEFEIKQDTDVLDTWFSSALHPFASLGWPKETEDMKKFYPLSLMETGNDLIFFWVARMVMLGMKLTGQVPFKNVLFHPMIRDKFNRKMSKSVGNVIDPLHVIDGATMKDRLEEIKQMGLDEADETSMAVKEMYKENNGEIPALGSDSLRLSLIAHSTDVANLRYEINQAIVARRFCSKVYHCMIFCYNYVNDEPSFAQLVDEARSNPIEIHPIEAWAKSRLAFTVQSCNKSMTEYKTHEAVDVVKKLWYEISDVYLRFCYFYLSEGEDSNQPNYSTGCRVTEKLLADSFKMKVVAGMVDIMEVCLRLFCPFAPFLSEELWQRIPKSLLKPDSPESICISSFPVPENIDAERNMKVEDEINRFLGVTEKVNQEKVRFLLPKTIDVVCVCRDKQSFESVGRLSHLFQMYFACNEVKVHELSELDELKRNCFGVVKDTDDVIVLYRLKNEDFNDYLSVQKIEDKLEHSRNQWIKSVEKLENKAKNNQGNVQNTYDKILSECEKYEKIDLFMKSLQFVKANTNNHSNLTTECS